MQRPAYEQSMQWMAAAVPDLAPLLREHIALYDEVLPYVVFESDYMHWLKRTVQAAPERPTIGTFLLCVETFLKGPNDDLSDLAWIGFVEHLIAGGDEVVLQQLHGELGPATRAAIVEYRLSTLELAELKDAYGYCRCPELSEVRGPGTSFYKEHLTWIDELQPGLDVYRCPMEDCFWSSSDRRAGAPVAMHRHPDERQATSAIRRLRNSLRP